MLPKITLHLLHLFITGDARALELIFFLPLFFPGKSIIGGFFNKSLETVRVFVVFQTSSMGVSNRKFSDLASVHIELYDAEEQWSMCTSIQVSSICVAIDHNLSNCFFRTKVDSGSAVCKPVFFN